MDNLLDKIFHKKEQSKRSTTTAVTSGEMSAAREYADTFMANLEFMASVNKLINGPKPEIDTRYHIIISMPIDTVGIAEIKVVFDRESKKPIYAEIKEIDKD